MWLTVGFVEKASAGATSLVGDVIEVAGQREVARPASAPLGRLWARWRRLTFSACGGRSRRGAGGRQWVEGVVFGERGGRVVELVSCELELFLGLT